MFYLTLCVDQRVKIGKDIEIVLTKTEREECRLGVMAPKEVPIFRSELLERRRYKNAKDNKSSSRSENQQ